MRCPLRHFFQYVLALPQRTTPSALVLGSATHQALAVFHRSIQEGKTVDREAVKSAFLQAWKERKDRQVVEFSHGTEQHELDVGISLLEVYLKQPPPEHVVAVEEEIVSPLVTSQGEVLDVALIGVLDLVTRSDTGLKVTDLKTSSRSYSEMEAQLSLQATCYLYSAHHHFGESASFEYQVLLKLKQPRVQTIATFRTTTDFQRLGDLVQTIERAVTTGVHYPIENPLNCSGCPYRKPCRDWQSDQSLPVETSRVSLTVGENDNYAHRTPGQGRVPLSTSSGRNSSLPTHHPANQ
jgi:CRISPR/Cas system-associated exonuclease Cas4 (RecB family)